MRFSFNIKLSTYRAMIKRGITVQRMREKDFRNADFSNLSFVSASFDYARFDSARFDYARFVYASFDYASFVSARFDYASFVYASFDYARFVSARFDYARFDYASFVYASFDYARFDYASFVYASFVSASFDYARFVSASFVSAIFDYARFVSASFDKTLMRSILRQYKNIRGISQRPPKRGEFTAWKKCSQGVMVKLLIPKDAKRSSATGKKCRASHAIVLQVKGEEYGVSIHDNETEYHVGQTVTCDKWEPSRWIECGGGIHFFMSYREAKGY